MFIDYSEEYTQSKFGVLHILQIKSLPYIKGTGRQECPL